MWRKAMMTLTAAAMLSACSWVELTPEGEKVRLLSAAEVSNCRVMGKTTVSLAAKVLGIERHPEDVQNELNMLARNSAVDLRGDTVVPLAPPTNGKQTFSVYRCMP